LDWLASLWSLLRKLQGSLGGAGNRRRRRVLLSSEAFAMGLLEWLWKGRGRGVEELARCLGIEEQQLRGIEPVYRDFTVPKRSGGTRRILAPDPELKSLQRRILRRVLGGLKAHPAATGFERGSSIVTNAQAHVGRAVVLRFDLVDFFSATSSGRVRAYFRRIGWNRPAATMLVRLCTHEGGLPQGAPTSPRLSNLVNYRLDARLGGTAARLGAVYTRYADDITISLHQDENLRVHALQRFVRRIVAAEDYRLHTRKKLSIRRRHQRQSVTGLVVNEQVHLPRETRRWLRAVEHRTKSSRRGALDGYEPLSGRFRHEPTLTPSQLAGWQAFRAMVAGQAKQK
jgi:RNA-directed DNA polymerase